MSIQFLSIANVLRIHRSSIIEYGGDPAVRDMALLESALAQPRAAFGGQYLHEDLPAMAAAYLFHMVSNHPFVDGNKRTGAGSAYIFLRMNDVRVTAPEDEFTQITLGVATGKTGKEEVAEFFRRYTKA